MLGDRVAMAGDLPTALTAANNSPVPGIGVNQHGQAISSIPEQVAGLISEAQTDSNLATAALKAQDLALYQQYEQDVATFINEAEALLASEPKKGSGGSGGGGSRGGGGGGGGGGKGSTTTTLPTSTSAPGSSSASTTTSAPGNVTTTTAST